MRAQHILWIAIALLIVIDAAGTLVELVGILSSIIITIIVAIDLTKSYIHE